MPTSASSDTMSSNAPAAKKSSAKKPSSSGKVNGFQAENEIKDLQFKLTHKLQSTLDVYNTLELFFGNIQDLIKLSGMRFETPGDSPLELGDKANHRAQYNITGSNANLGTITFFRKTHFLEGELAALEMFIGILFYPLRNALLYKEALACSLRDTLTGIGNRKAMDMAFEREVKLGIRHTQPLCVLFVDIDHFKKINDSVGHRAGDKLLQHIVGGLQSTMRDTDQLFRFGGEEFIVLLNNTDIAAAKLIAERIRIYVAMTPITFEKKTLPITVSIGVSELESTDTADSLLKRADTALYSAKRSGRNQVSCADSSDSLNASDTVAG